MSPILLPPDITEEILSRLPPKSLGRCKSVSKTWHSLISDIQFIIRYQKNTKLLLTSDVGSLYTLDINSLLDLSSPTAKEVIFQSYPNIWGSCHGLVLAQKSGCNLFLMNPTTKELWNVPRNPFLADLAHINGFGYDPSTDDYKILSIRNERLYWSWNDMFVSVYSLRGNSWRKLPNAPKLYKDFRSSTSFLVNHNLHMLVSKRSERLTIMAFSLESEEFNEIQVPDSIKNATAFGYNLVVFRGKLAIFRCDSGHDLWVMEEYGMPKSWTKVCCFHGEDGRYVSAVCLVERNDRDIILGNFQDDGSVLVYNIDARRYRKVQIDGVTSAFIVQGTYVETIESPFKYIRIAACGKLWSEVCGNI